MVRKLDRRERYCAARGLVLLALGLGVEFTPEARKIAQKWGLQVEVQEASKEALQAILGDKSSADRLLRELQERIEG